MRFNKLLGKIHLKSKGVTMEINCPLEIRQLIADKKKIKKKWQRIRATDDIKQIKQDLPNITKTHCSTKPVINMYKNR